eukprot:8779512-Karenia_brevis.AAC.1
MDAFAIAQENAIAPAIVSKELQNAASRAPLPSPIPDDAVRVANSKRRRLTKKTSFVDNKFARADHDALPTATLTHD